MDQLFCRHELFINTTNILQTGVNHQHISILLTGIVYKHYEHLADRNKLPACISHLHVLWVMLLKLYLEKITLHRYTQNDSRVCATYAPTHHALNCTFFASCRTQLSYTLAFTGPYCDSAFRHPSQVSYNRSKPFASCCGSIGCPLGGFTISLCYCNASRYLHTAELPSHLLF